MKRRSFMRPPTMAPSIFSRMPLSVPGSTESDALLKALNETDNLQGVVGKYKPNTMREMVHEGIICKLEDGTAVYLDSITVED